MTCIKLSNVCLAQPIKNKKNTNNITNDNNNKEKQQTKCTQNARIITLLNFTISNYLYIYIICRHIYTIVFIIFENAMQTYLSLSVVHFYVYHSYNLCNCVFYSSLLVYRYHAMIIDIAMNWLKSIIFKTALRLLIWRNSIIN